MKRNFFFFCALFFIFGCEGWYGAKPDKPLPGERTSILAIQGNLQADPKLANLPFNLPEPKKNKRWPQKVDNAIQSIQHFWAKASLRPFWETNIGEGSDDEAKLIASPIVVNNRIYTMDAEAKISVFDVKTGEVLWQKGLTPPEEDYGTMGGGLGYSLGVLYVTTGFAEVIALNAQNGELIWKRKVNSPIRAAPTIFKEYLFAVSISNEMYALDIKHGKLLWSHLGIAEKANLLGGAAPTVGGSVVIASYSSGELIALQIENGRLIWTNSIRAIRRLDPLSSLAHIRGKPIIDRGFVILTANSGRTMTIDLRTGARIWEIQVGSGNDPWDAGDNVFITSNNGELLCIVRKTGGIRWKTRLPKYKDEKDKEGPIFWSGPILVGNRLLVGGSNKQVFSLSPFTGLILDRIETSGPIFIRPIIANGIVFILSDNAKLLALH